MARARRLGFVASASARSARCVWRRLQPGAVAVSKPWMLSALAVSRSTTSVAPSGLKAACLVRVRVRVRVRARARTRG